MFEFKLGNFIFPRTVVRVRCRWIEYGIHLKNHIYLIYRIIKKDKSHLYLSNRVNNLHILFFWNWHSHHMGHNGNSIFHLFVPEQMTSFQDEFSRKEVIELLECWSTSKVVLYRKYNQILMLWSRQSMNLLLDHKLYYLPWRDN